MDDHNQIEIPASFVALYSRNGRPTESRRTIEARYDLCEDLAIQTSDACLTLRFAEDLSDAAVLGRCRAGLVESGAANPAEAEWVVVRVAELLHWQRPEPVAARAAD